MHRVFRLANLVCAAWLCATLAQDVARGVEPAATKGPARKTGDDHFNEYILPIFKQHCYECHSHAAGKAKGGLVLDSRGGWAKGGDSGPAIVPGKPDESLLIQAVRYAELEMPPSGKLPAEAVATLQRWVASGAADPRVADSATVQAGIDWEAGRKHWAFQPLRSVEVPKVKNAKWPLGDVDRFLLARLETQGLRPAADADRYTWLRRVSLDLTGLPPSVEEINAFIADGAPDAFERVVNRLLASRHFGERWGRHWLDLVGYADQIGTANDIFAEHAWRYRDYVIAAFNDDKPFDQFIREQLAGDLLPYQSPAQHAEQLVATGFLLLGDLTVVEADKAKLRIDTVDQQVDKLGRAFLGLTLGCARCHDHKFDPIAQRDYYAIAGILNNTESIQKASWGVWSWPMVVDLPETEAQQAERELRLETHRSRVEAMKTERTRLQTRQSEIEAALKKTMPATPPESSGAAPAAEVAELRAELEKTAQELTDKLKKLDGEITHAEFFTPAPPKVFAVRDVATPADMRITIRGNAHALGEQVPRGFLQVVAFGGVSPALPRESGRRQLADWIASADNPLTARVTVNRIWQKLFGEGLVRSVDYFGLPGERPSHPELLDHLATRFVNQGWSYKRMIRDLALSRAYRMSSQVDARQRAADSDNRLLARMNRRRVDAEALRDSLLAVSGKLIESSGGPSLPLEYLENTGNLNPGNVNPPSFRLTRFRPDQQYIRTVYLPIIRSGAQAGPSELRNVFDFTQPAEFASQRAITAVPTQALFLMNSSTIKARARELAERMVHETPDEAVRIQRLWLRVLNRPVLDAERAEAAAFLKSWRDDASVARSSDAETRAWTELCHSLLASNEFLMRM
jgi:hypothetical protein